MTTISDKDRAEAQAMAEVFHDCETVVTLSDDGVRWWLAVRDHVLAAHECPTVPVWRPVIDGEDLTGYEVRSRGEDVDVWHAWGVAARRLGSGRWLTEGGWALTGWPVTETTAPIPEPELWDEGLVEDVAGAIDHYDGFSDHELARSLLNLLADRGLIERPKAGA